MPIVKNTNDVSIEFKPWTDNDHRIVNLHMAERIGGTIAFGEMELWNNGSNRAVGLITNQQDGTIQLKDNKDGGLSYEIPIFIMSREYLANTLKIKFLCIKNKKFIVDLISVDHKDITTALYSPLYPGKLDIRIKSDISNNIPIYQCRETNYDLCTRLAASFKKESIFCFGFDRFTLKDLCGKYDSQGKKEPNFRMTGSKLFFNTTPYNLAFSKTINYSPYNPWEDITKTTTLGNYRLDEGKNWRVQGNYETYDIMGKEYTSLYENYRYNQNLMDARMYSTFKITGTDVPKYRIGDVILYTRAEQDKAYPFTKFLVASNEVFYSGDSSKVVSPEGFNFSWSSILFGLEDGKWGKGTGILE